MTFVLACLFYSFIGCVTGFFAHIFNGLVQSQIQFDWQYILRTVRGFGRVLSVMSLATLITAILILFVPDSFLAILGTDTMFFRQLVFYLLAFAAFDFGLKN
ncbi:MAG: hypothetical protein H7230_02740 [Candidatus Parcubacteria bacterium]|nr:hypothetical protein [Candidatus Paceibacterota bacterium]